MAEAKLAGKQLDLRLVAATLAAALIRPGMGVAEVSEIYFDFLRALKADRRHVKKEKESTLSR